MEIELTCKPVYKVPYLINVSMLGAEIVANLARPGDQCQNNDSSMENCLSSFKSTTIAPSVPPRPVVEVSQVSRVVVNEFGQGTRMYHD